MPISSYGLIAFLLYGSILYAQPTDPQAIIDRVKSQALQVNDFQADVHIEVDVDFLRMPVKEARIFYKRPDKLKFKAKGFLMIPRKGVHFSADEYLGGNVSALYVKAEKLDNALTDVIKVIPLDNEADLVLATLWVDREKAWVRKVEAHTRESGSYQVHFLYGDAPFDLPVQTILSFEVNRMQLPLKFVGQLKVDPGQVGEQAAGTVILRYSNFKVNGGISDSEFLETEQE